MSYKLFIDDERIPYVPEEWNIARTSQEAIELVQTKGMPTEMSLDHDLGMICSLKEGEENTSFEVEDTVMTFLKWLAFTFWKGKEPIPEYAVHSANIVGKKNIISFMESWKRSVNLK